MLEPIPWPLVLVPPCTGSLDLVEEKESSETPNFTQVGRRLSRKGNSLEKAKGQLFHLGSTPVFVSGPIKGMKENKMNIHPSIYSAIELSSVMLFIILDN